MCVSKVLKNCSTLLALLAVLVLSECSLAQGSNSTVGAAGNSSGDVSGSDLGISFIDGSRSEIVVVENGHRYIVNTETHTIRADDKQESPVAGASLVSAASGTSEGVTGTSSSIDNAQASSAAPSQSQPPATTPAPEKKKRNIYTPGDDLVFSVPTGRRPERHGFYINFTHRFPFEPAFTSSGRGNTLLGLDDFAIPSFGFRYGVTSKFSVFAYRASSVIGRPIELMAAYNFLSETDGQPLNAAVRLSIDGQNNFRNNYTENIELTLSRSLTHRAQVYVVPTFSIRNRPTLGDISAPLQNAIPVQSCRLPLAVGVDPALKVRPCANTVSLGIAAAVDIRPTVAIVAEAIPTLVNGPELGIHRSPFSFGIQKRLWRHAFTLGFTNSPGTTVSNRAGTNATFLQQPGADKPSNMFIGFDLTRQVY